MKILFISLFPILIAIPALAQDKFLDYTNLVQNFTYEVFIDKESKEDENFTLIFYANPINGKDTVGFLITRNEYNDFMTALESAKAKYEEWIQSAEEYKVVSYAKNMKMHFTTAGFFFANKTIQTFYPLTVGFHFAIKESEDKTYINYILTIVAPPFLSIKDPELITEGFTMQFYSPHDFNNFLNAISKEKIDEYKPVPTLDEIFKD